MSYNLQLAERIRNYFIESCPDLKVEEKQMFGGLCFMVDNKMCVNASENNLMCRFNPEREQEVTLKKGYLPMVMKGKYYVGYCYVEPAGYASAEDFDYWMMLCLDYNNQAKSSKK